jgi:Flp pilus assembly pilin Flp
VNLIRATEPETKPQPQGSSRPARGGKETTMDLLARFSLDEAGASAVEYAFLLAFIAVAIAASVMTFGNAIRDSFVTSTTKMFGSG